MTRNHHFWLPLGLVLIGQVSAWGYATGIELISVEHHVWGSAGRETMYGPGGTEVFYDQTSPDPLHVSVTGTYWDPWAGRERPLVAWSEAGDFRAQAHGTYWFSEAYAQSIYVFTPQVGAHALTFELSGSGDGVGLSAESNIRFALDDLTAGTSLALLTAPSELDWQAGQWSCWSLDRIDTYFVDPAHTYGMTLFAYAGNGDGTRGASLDVDVLPIIPAPGALLLAVIGTALVGRTRSSALR